MSGFFHKGGAKDYLNIFRGKNFKKGMPSPPPPPERNLEYAALYGVST